MITKEFIKLPVSQSYDIILIEMESPIMHYGDSGRDSKFISTINFTITTSTTTTAPTRAKNAIVMKCLRQIITVTVMKRMF